MLEVRFFIEEHGAPHIYMHGVVEAEVLDVLDIDNASYREDYQGREGARICIGQTSAGRYLKVVYIPDKSGNGVFVVTAYELTGKPLAAFRRRRKRS